MGIRVPAAADASCSERKPLVNKKKHVIDNNAMLTVVVTALLGEAVVSFGKEVPAPSFNVLVLILGFTKVTPISRANSRGILESMILYK
jgi:hypothetical protein